MHAKILDRVLNTWYTHAGIIILLESFKIQMQLPEFLLTQFSRPDLVNRHLLHGEYSLYITNSSPFTRPGKGLSSTHMVSTIIYMLVVLRYLFSLQISLLRAQIHILNCLLVILTSISIKHLKLICSKLSLIQGVFSQWGKPQSTEANKGDFKKEAVYKLRFQIQV